MVGKVKRKGEHMDYGGGKVRDVRRERATIKTGETDLSEEIDGRRTRRNRKTSTSSTRCVTTFLSQRRRERNDLGFIFCIKHHIEERDMEKIRKTFFDFQGQND